MVKLAEKGRTHVIAVSLATAALLTVAASVLSSCNTTAGFGQDMQAAGRGVENSADKNNKY